MEKEINLILKSIDTISNKGYKSKFTETYQTSVSKQSQIVSEYLGVESERQSILWSILFSMTISKNSSIDLDEFSSYLNTSILKILLYQSDFDELVKRKLLKRHKPSRRRRNTESLNYMNLYVPNDIIISLVNGETTLPKRRKNDLTIYDIFDIVLSFVQERYDGMIDYDELCNEFDVLMMENKEHPFIKQIVKHKLPVIEQIILIYVCSQFTDGVSSVDLIDFLKTIHHDTQSQLRVRKEFLQEKTKIQQSLLVELVTENFKSDRYIQLTNTGKSLFGEDLNLFVDKDISNHKDIILSSGIVEQKLFFNEKEKKSLDFLTDLLRPDNYNSVVNRMKDLGMKPGFTVLFHGHPGTGKTESVYQISRMTGRDIKRVEISETKSKWYGESEKLIKNIFTSYKRLVDTTELTPILLFNEVDGVLKNRQIGTSKVDNTESTVVTILLNEIENFEGVLLSTSNNTSFDRSFDRRFLYKIYFNKPDSDTRFLIWKDKLPVLTDEEIMNLSKTFELSGGMIQNIKKKVEMTSILTGNIPTFQEIQGYCDDEFLEKKTERNRIGFKVGSV